MRNLRLFSAFLMEGSHLIFGIVDWFIAAVFGGLAILSYKKASLSMIIGLCFYILLNSFFVLIEPTSILNGIILKILVITYLIYAIKSAKEEEKLIIKNHQTDLLDQI